MTSNPSSDDLNTTPTMSSDSRLDIPFLNEVYNMHERTYPDTRKLASEKLIVILDEGASKKEMLAKLRDIKDARITDSDELDHTTFAGLFGKESRDFLRTSAEVALIQEDRFLIPHERSVPFGVPAPWFASAAAVSEGPAAPPPPPPPPPPPAPVHIRQIESMDDPSWGIARLYAEDVTQPDLIPPTYQYDNNACGHGVDVYLAEADPINTTHAEFEGRVNLYGRANDTRDLTNSNWHGTFVTAIAAGTTHGVAKQATIVPVRLESDLDFARDVREILNTKSQSGRPAVVNISDQQWHYFAHFVVTLIKAGVHVVVAAGNYNLPVPPWNVVREKDRRHLESVICVSASDARNRRHTNGSQNGSDFGPMVDVFAPGHNIEGIKHSDAASKVREWGTSFAAPFVTGIVACLLSHPDNKTLPPKEMKEKIMAMAWPNVVDLADKEIMKARAKMIISSRMADSLQEIKDAIIKMVNNDMDTDDNMNARVVQLVKAILLRYIADMRKINEQDLLPRDEKQSQLLTKLNGMRTYIQNMAKESLLHQINLLKDIIQPAFFHPDWESTVFDGLTHMKKIIERDGDTTIGQTTFKDHLKLDVEHTRPLFMGMAQEYLLRILRGIKKHFWLKVAVEYRQSVRSDLELMSNRINAAETWLQFRNALQLYTTGDNNLSNLKRRFVEEQIDIVVDADIRTTTLLASCRLSRWNPT